MEKARQSRFPDKPSRLNCIFLWRNVDDAQWFRLNQRYDGAPIYRVTLESSPNARHEADINMAALMGTVDIRGLEQVLNRADAYWSHQPHEGARVEVLVNVPVKVVVCCD